MSAETGAAAARRDRAGIGIGFFLLIVGGIVAWDAAHIAGGAGGYARIGPAAFPYAVALGLIVLGVATLVEALRGTPEREPLHLAPLFWIIGGLLVQVALLPIAGFSIATGAVFAGTARGFGRGPLWFVYPIGVVVSLIIWIAFNRGLKLVLPTGLLERFF